MRYSKSRLLTLTVCAMAIAPFVTMSAAQTSGRHIRKHHHGINLVRSPVRDSWAAAPSVAPPPARAGQACPGNARAVDCTVWPPPIDEDPDRKATSSDGG
ncbi:MAG TPA: hypothetical protein VFL62_12980 [Bradyrhizobium sp.]|uniref:hypothetical protein n=1 Tax=Bradyrhizobium sp. TaxID=376 RepID=UPI002D7F209D|nr:hypothetical protein [Bradyrhizobium sp.]HET7887135.1 hypothetical protein [Bradyrhizobium sp.]